jgi:hypothetical protein
MAKEATSYFVALAGASTNAHSWCGIHTQPCQCYAVRQELIQVAQITFGFSSKAKSPLQKMLQQHYHQNPFSFCPLICYVSADSRGLVLLVG